MRKILFLFLVVTTLVFVTSNVFAAKKLTLGVTIETFDDVFMQNVLDEMKREAKKQKVRLVAVDGKGDPVEQIKQVDNFITNRVDAIIVHVINQDIAQTITKKVVAAKIPLVYMNRRPNDRDLPKGKLVAAVSSPEEEAGQGQAKFVAEKIGNTGNVAILLGTLGTGPQIGRTKGVEDYLRKNTKIKVVRKQTGNFKRPDALAVVENWLASGVKFDAILANNDEMAIGAANALKERGMKKDIVVVGVDASPDGIAALESGLMDMTMFQNGRAQGSGSVKVAIKMANGEKFNQDILIPFEPVTKENAKKYK